MALIRAEIKRGCLRSLFRQATAQSVPLQLTLDAFQDGGFKAIKSGKIVVATSGAGHSTTFAVPDQWRSFSQEELFSLTEELEQVYSDTKAQLITNGNASPDDQTIFDAMIADDRLQTVNRTQTDYTLVNYPNRF